MKQVKAAVLTAPGKMEIREYPYPDREKTRIVARTELAGICTKNVRIIGVGNHPYTEYGKVLRMLERSVDTVPFDQMISHTFSLSRAEEAICTSMEPDSLKVVIEP